MLYNKKSIEDIDVQGKRVLVRADFNVPLKDGVITDESRILGVLPTIQYLINHEAKIILCSHLGKPKGDQLAAFSLEPVAKRLSALLGKPVGFTGEIEVVGPKTREAASAMLPGDVILLENTRFRSEESKNGEAFSKALASLADIFVNDAFGSAHRAHSSTVGVTEFIDTAVCGYLIEKELKYLGAALSHPERPFVAILGGAKVSDKIEVIRHLLEKVDALIIGGGMAYTFLKAEGHLVGNSLVEADKMEYALEMIEAAKKAGVELLLPVDHVYAEAFSNESKPHVSLGVEIPTGYMGLDIGPKTILAYQTLIRNAKTVIWNGPLGVFEFDAFSKGTFEIAKTLSEIDAITIIGGGDSAAAVNQFGFGDKMSHISTGGGASLEFLEGKLLPGIAALNDR